jgi:hypothetical protein
MAMAAGEGQNWSLLQWALTLLITTVVSAIAFVWRLVTRIEKLENGQRRQRDELETLREANDATMLRLAERFAQLHDDHFRLREAMGAMPTRSDLRELEERLAVRLTALSDRIDRVIDA